MNGPACGDNKFGLPIFQSAGRFSFHRVESSIYINIKHYGKENESNAAGVC